MPRISAHAYAALRGELLALGVIHVAQLSLEDWASVRALSAWLPFQLRRLVQALRWASARVANLRWRWPWGQDAVVRDKMSMQGFSATYEPH